MSYFEIEGGYPLDGKLLLKSAKNAILPIMAASIMIDGDVYLLNPPKIQDVLSMRDILEHLGCEVIINEDFIKINSQNIKINYISPILANKLRSSIFLLGPLLSRLKKAKVSYPGGCDIGLRPIDIHIQGLRELGVKVKEEFGYIDCDSSFAKSNQVILDLPSVGATENLIMSSVFLNGDTYIYNCAKEPEIVDLQNFLNKCGAKVEGAGTSCIRISGVDKLVGVEYTPIPDRIVAGTYLLSTVMCGGEIEISHYVPEHLFSLVSKLSKTCCKIMAKNGRIFLKSKGRPKSIEHIETMYYPGFPTDLQTQMLALQTISYGSSLVVENIFETRYRPVGELLKMGADITVRGRSALVRGVEDLHGSQVSATDLRGGASLVMAGLKANGVTRIDNIGYIDRGYEDMSYVIKSLGGHIRRVIE